MPHVTPANAIHMAEAYATGTWDGHMGRVHNAGAPDTDYIYADEAPGLIEAWRGRAMLRGCNRRASQSSGEPKVDLKLAAPGAAASCLNYHIRFQARPRAATGPTEAQIAASRRADIEKIMNNLRKQEGRDPIKINWHGVPGTGDTGS